MFKLNAGYSQEDEAHQVWLGLESENLELLQQEKPILIEYPELGLPLGAPDLFISFASDRTAVAQQLERLGASGEISVLDLAGDFWFTPLTEHKYLIFLHAESIAALIAGRLLSFRARTTQIRLNLRVTLLYASKRILWALKTKHGIRFIGTFEQDSARRRKGIGSDGTYIGKPEEYE